MPFLSGANNQFKFEFPRLFIPEHIENKFGKLINRIPGFPFESVIDFINFAIQSVSLDTAINSEIIEQTDVSRNGGEGIYRSHENPAKFQSKEFTVTFKMDSAYLVYFILADLFYYYYIEYKEKMLPDAIYLSLLDGYDKELYRINFRRVLFKSVGRFSLDFSNSSIDMKEITATFVCGGITMEVMYQPTEDHITTPPTPNPMQTPHIKWE